MWLQSFKDDSATIERRAFLVDAMGVLVSDDFFVRGGEELDVVRGGLWLVVRGS